MWILTNSKELLEYIQANFISLPFYFLALYTTNQHTKLKESLKENVQFCFKKETSQHRYKYLFLESYTFYFANKIHSDSIKKYSEFDIILILIDNTFVMFGGRIFQQRIGIGIPMGSNCAPLLTDVFLYTYETDFIQGLLKNEKKLNRSFNFRFRYKDDVLSLNKFKL